ncbi:putative glucuronosyltransferase PGSIP8 [Tanacetum coccineum]
MPTSLPKPHHIRSSKEMMKSVIFPTRTAALLIPNLIFNSPKPSFSSISNSIPFRNPGLFRSRKSSSSSSLCCYSSASGNGNNCCEMDGEVHVIVGPMFAGKTTTLLKRIKSESTNGRLEASKQCADNTLGNDSRGTRGKDRMARGSEEEDGAKVVRVENLKNPYMSDDNHDRFKLTLNKLYAWSLVEYDRIIMLDADNLFLQNTDELFQCGQFCAVFINPCFIGGVSDLCQRFHPPPNGTKLNGTFRLPLGYQMDATYYYLRLRWSVPCGPNSVITFPGASWLKPWYDSEMPFVLIQSILYLGIIAVTRLARPSLSKLCYRGAEKTTTTIQTILKAIAIFSIFVSYTLPFLLVPHTIHPILGWTLYLLGSFALSCIATNAFLLPMLRVLTLWVGIVGALIVMAYPWYNDGVVRALSIFAYAFFVAPILWISMVKIGSSLHISLEREAFLPSRITESTQPPSFNKLY